MRKFVIGAAIFMACALSACASSGGKQQGTAAPDKPESQPGMATGAWLDSSTYDDYAPTEPMKGSYIDAATELTRKLMTRCIDTTGTAKINACYRDGLLAGFDTHDVAKKHCPQDADFDQHYICIMYGSYGYQFIQAFKPDVEPEIDWTDPERTMQAAITEFIVANLASCLGGSSASDPTQCVMDGVSKQLDLRESDIEPCRVLTDDMEFAQCIGEADILIFLRDGIARM